MNYKSIIISNYILKTLLLLFNIIFNYYDSPNRIQVLIYIIKLPKYYVANRNYRLALFTFNNKY